MLIVFIELIAIFCVGLILGSFATALIYRVPLKKNWVSERSSCSSCKHVLSGFDLIPFFSWLISRGQCRYCSSNISFFYPLLEIVTASLCVLVYMVYGLTLETCFIISSIPFLMSLLMIDFRHMILPNQLVLILGVLGILRLCAFVIFADDSLESVTPYVLGAIIYAILSWGLGWGMTRILKKNSLGLGDVKFFCVAGLWLGLWLLPYFMIISGVISIVIALVWQKIYHAHKFPMGPALICSFYILLLLKPPF